MKGLEEVGWWWNAGRVQCFAVFIVCIEVFLLRGSVSGKNKILALIILLKKYERKLTSLLHVTCERSSYGLGKETRHSVQKQRGSDHASVKTKPSGAHDTVYNTRQYSQEQEECCP